MRYSCTHMATVGVKGLSCLYCALLSVYLWYSEQRDTCYCVSRADCYLGQDLSSPR